MAPLLLQLLFRPLLVRHIPSNSGDADGLAVRILEQGACHVIGNGTEVFGEQMAVKFGVPFREGPQNGGGGAGLFFRRHEGQGGLVQQFLWAVSRYVHESPIPFYQVGLGVEGKHISGIVSMTFWKLTVLEAFLLNCLRSVISRTIAQM